jgi:hypothetical protein
MMIFCESARQTPKKRICRARRQMIIPMSSFSSQQQMGFHMEEVTKESEQHVERYLSEFELCLCLYGLQIHDS